MAVHRLTWTPEMVDALKSMRRQGLPLLRCAELLGVDYKTAVYKARELSLAGRHRKPGPLDKKRAGTG